MNNFFLSHRMLDLNPATQVTPTPMPGRYRRDPIAHAERSHRERERLQSNFRCDCTFPGCSGMVSRKTLARHAEWMAAQAQIAANLSGIHDLRAGYPAPEHQVGLDIRQDDFDGDDSDAELKLGDVAVGEAGGEGDVDPVAEIGPLQARSTHFTPHFPSWSCYTRA